jgi:hypothetical protein
MRDCYVGVRAVRRLLAVVTDDVGDLLLALSREGGPGAEVEKMHDTLEDVDTQLEKLRTRLRALSEGKP